MRSLVAGGAGFVGAHLCRSLLSRGDTVLCFDNLSTGSRDGITDLLGHPRFTFIHADLLEPLAELSAVDRIYHLASPASPRAYQQLPIETLRVNAEGSYRLLESAERWGARFLFASTSEVYGDPLVHPQPETYAGNVSPVGPRSMYDEAKRYGEALTVAFARTRNVETRVARIFNTFGPGMALDDGRVVSNFIVQALRGEPLTIYGDGSQTRSFQYVSDLVTGLVRLMESSLSMPVNLGNPEELTMRELADAVTRLTGSSAGIRVLPLPADDPKQRRPDISLARRELGWAPVVPLEDGLRHTIAYVSDEMSRQRSSISVAFS